MSGTTSTPKPALRIPPLVGLLGMLFLVLAVELNDQVLNTSLWDVAGALGLSHDEAVWLPSLYLVAEIVGMATAPTMAAIFTLRRFALSVAALATLPTLLMTTGPGVSALFFLRLVQGLAGGWSIPLLMMTALRVLPPPIRLYDLAVYACSATIAPNLATSLAALWTDGLQDWHFIFLGVIPFVTIAAVLIWFGLDQDPPRYPMLRQFDWPGVIFVLMGFGSLVVALEQANRLDWLNSPTICLLFLCSAIGIPALVLRELHAPQPLFRLDLLKRRNFAYALIALVLVLIIALGSGPVPISFLTQIHGYRPAQAHVLTLFVAATQLLLLPLTAFILDFERVDARWISACGMSLILIALICGTNIGPEWIRGNFMMLQALYSIGLAFIVVPLLMLATNEVKQPEAMYASGMINMPRAVAGGLGTGVLDAVERWRGALHHGRLLDTLGHARYRAVQAQPVGAYSPALVPDGTPREPHALQALNETIEAQATTLVTLDTFCVLAGFVVLLLLILALYPVRSYPPRIQLTRKA
ncbi:MFS transporter [Gluconacetobacter sacchari]|uniref:MFS transporter n=1 Tax=Gluconacetobacter sacchari TaxID=92759 RepID=UPI0039B6622F